MLIEAIRGLALGGAETLLYSRLKSWMEQGVLPEVRILNTHPNLDHYTQPIKNLGIPVIEAASSSLMDGYAAVRHACGDMGPEDTLVIHSPVVGGPMKLQRSLSKGRRPRFAIIDVVHASRYRAPYELYGRVFNRHIDGAIWVSEEVKNSPAGEGYRAGVVVPGGVDRAAMRQWVVRHPRAWFELVAEAGIGRGDGLVVSVGNLLAVKGHERLLRALLHPELWSVHAVIVGEGPERAALSRLINELGLNGRVALIGSRPDAWRWLAVADVVCHPSIMEGLPVTLMEAVTLGVPVVATDVGGIGSVVGRRDVLVSPEAVDFAPGLISQLKIASPISAAFPERAATPSHWDVRRFAGDFLSAVEGLGRSGRI